MRSQIVVGNHGAVTMGLTLLPQADAEDGRLDGIVLLQRTALDWISAAWRLVRKDARGSRHLPQMQGREIEVISAVPLPVEVDGDVIGQARRIRFRVQPQALLVRA